jgi:hypothetical protein
MPRAVSFSILITALKNIFRFPFGMLFNIPVYANIDALFIFASSSSVASVFSQVNSGLPKCPNAAVLKSNDLGVQYASAQSSKAGEFMQCIYS